MSEPIPRGALAAFGFIAASAGGGHWRRGPPEVDSEKGTCSFTPGEPMQRIDSVRFKR